MILIRLTLVLSTILVAGGFAVAGKTSSGVGGSHSFGGKGASSGGVHSSGGKSYSPGGAHSSGGKSYSSGASSSGGKGSASAGSSSGKSYSSVGAHPSSGPAAGKSLSNGSGSSASHPSSDGSRPSTSSGGRTKGGDSYDSAAIAAARRAESRSSYRNPSGRDFGASSAKPNSGKSYSSPNYSSNAAPRTPGAQPRSTYTDDRGRSRPLDPNDARVGQIRNKVNSDWYYTRPARSHDVFINVNPYPGYPSVYYSDPYSNMFWWWLLGNRYSYGPSWGYPGFDLLDLWVYHHYNVMDRLRYQDLVQRNANLEAHVRALEQRGVVRDPTWSPPGVDSDLMYTDQYVDAALNPTPAPAVTQHQSHHLGRLLFEALIVIGFLALLVWLVFLKRWGGTNSLLGNRVQS